MKKAKKIIKREVRRKGCAAHKVFVVRCYWCRAVKGVLA